MSDERNVVDLKVKGRPRRDNNTLQVAGVDYKACQHRRFIVDERLAEVTCGDCKAKLNPIWVLVNLANEEHGMWQRYTQMRATVELLKGKTRTKCEHCQRSTRIKQDASATAVYILADQIGRDEANNNLTPTPGD